MKRKFSQFILTIHSIEINIKYKKKLINYFQIAEPLLTGNRFQLFLL